MRVKPRFLMNSTLVVLILAVAVGAGSEVTGAQTEGRLPARIYVPQTGQAVPAPFHTAWLREYGVNNLGLPVSPLVRTNDREIQWFEYGRLERITSPPTAEPVVQRAPVGRIHASRAGYLKWHSAFRPVATSGDGIRFFERTSHTLANDFLRTYEERELERFLGSPISEEFRMGDQNVQFFEYGALTWRPDRGTELLPLGVVDAAHHGAPFTPEARLPNDLDYGSSDILEMSKYFPGERWIEIDLSDHMLTAYVGDFPLMMSQVVTGPPQSPTPIGEFRIYIKHEIQSLSGIGWDGTPYSAPDTPWVMYFYQDFGIHGSTWRNTYGYGSGQGCVIPPNDVAEALWKWADYGTRIVVKP